MIKQKKCIATIFVYIFLKLFLRETCEDVHLKKAAFSTSVFHMFTSSYGFHSSGFLYKMKKYKRIKKFFHSTSRSNPYKKIAIL